MDSGGPEQITVMSDCTKACVCVCTGFRFSRPPALHLMFPSPLPVFFFSPFSFCSYRFAHIPLSCRFSLLWSSGWSQLVGGQQLFFAGNRNPLCGKKKMGLSLATLFANNLHVLVSLLVLDWLSVLFTVALADR